MKKIARRLCLSALILVGVAALLLGTVWVFLGPAVKRGVERIGPKLLGVPVTVEKVTIRLWKSRIELKNLRIENPDGFSSDPALTLDELRLSVRLGSLLGRRVIEVREIRFDHPRIAYEVVKGDVNLKALQRKTESGAEAKDEKKPAARDAPGSERLYIIDRFECRNGEVLCRAELTRGEPKTVPLPLIVATGIGRNTHGATQDEVMDRLLLEILNGVGTVATRFFSDFVPGKDSPGTGRSETGGGVKGAIRRLHLPF